MIFEVFQTLPSSHSEASAGVGLAIVKKLVEDRNGMVWISQTQNKVSTYILPGNKSESAKFSFQSTDTCCK